MNYDIDVIGNMILLSWNYVGLKTQSSCFKTLVSWIGYKYVDGLLLKV